jgi:hypothetical protein
MSTLMTIELFERLNKIREALVANPAFARGPAERIAGLCVPWAGPGLKESGGIYYLGMATSGDYWADAPQTFDARSQVARSLCANRHERAHRPFWQFLDGLTWALLGAPFDETSDRWGWSNLLKIGWSGGNPDEWPSPIKLKLAKGVALDIPPPPGDTGMGRARAER